jgi:hypothetical protein
MRLPQAGAGLREMSSATTNSRSGLMQPGTIANKAMSMSRMEDPEPIAQHELTSSEATRPKTANTESKRPGSVSGQPSTTTKTHTRGNSYASSTTTRPTAPATRSMNGAFSSTVGPGTRPASAMSRPASAMSRPQSSFSGRRPVGASIPRAASALDTHMEDTSPSVLGKRKGMPQSSLSPSRLPSCPIGFAPPGLDRGWNELSELAALSVSEKPVSSRSSSNSSFFSLLPNTPSGNVSSVTTPGPPGYVQRSSRSTLFATPAIPHRTSSASPRRIANKPSHPAFLTKCSSIRSFDNITGPEWDQESREKNIEGLMQTLMAQMNQQGEQSSGLKDTVEFYKARGKLSRVRATSTPS